MPELVVCVNYTPNTKKHKNTNTAAAADAPFRFHDADPVAPTAELASA